MRAARQRRKPSGQISRQSSAQPRGKRHSPKRALIGLDTLNRPARRALVQGVNCSVWPARNRGRTPCLYQADRYIGDPSPGTVREMYLKQIYIENSGPLRQFGLNLDFTTDGLPKPLILVGPNGSGKTNLLSLITDALFEAAAAHYQNALPHKGVGRAWFRMVGGRTTTVGASGGFSLLRFEHNYSNLIYKEKAGLVYPREIADRLPNELAGEATWPPTGSYKQFQIEDDVSRKIFEENVLAYFPSSRSEIPFWLNKESIPEADFSIYPALQQQLRKPIYVERSLDHLKQWIISVIMDSRTHFIENPTMPNQFHIIGDASKTLQSASLLSACNEILQKILGEKNAYFAWLGRKSPEKLAVVRGNKLLVPNIDALSSGQAILLGLFGTLLRYGDQSNVSSNLVLSDISGICIVDEIDSHIHIDLQHNVIPQLVQLFPRIQFIISSHSPLFILGMKNAFSGNGFQLVEMPSGNIVLPEAFSEFKHALDALAATESFNARILTQSAKPGLPVVFVEGETDAPYLKRAAELLDRNDLLERCEIQWIGAKDEGGQGFHTGKDALNHTLNVLRANPKLSSRNILLLYDNDVNKKAFDAEGVSVRVIPKNTNNRKVKVGIENLLSESCISDDDYAIAESVKPNGDVVSVRTLRKNVLCKKICETGSASDVEAFRTALDVIEDYLNRIPVKSER